MECKGIAHEFQRPEGSTFVGYEYIPSVGPSNVVDGTVCKCGEAQWLSEREMPIPIREEAELARIRCMVSAGNYDCAIMALIDLLERTRNKA
jgi:hypothetical protein